MHSLFIIHNAHIYFGDRNLSFSIFVRKKKCIGGKWFGAFLHRGEKEGSRDIFPLWGLTCQVESINNSNCELKLLLVIEIATAPFELAIS